jgi:ligand-binding SRPBCC domain-containing protein
MSGSFQFIKESRIEAPAARVFAFHESPGTLERLTPPWEYARVIRSAGSLRPGSRVEIETRVGPFSLCWIAEHTEYEPGRLFADRQVRGPFAYWYHRHRFIDLADGASLLRDEVDYEPPLRALGRWLAGRYLQRKLTRLFDYRHAVTKRLVESGEFPGARPS